MSRADQLARLLGENMSESLGVRGPVANDLGPAAKPRSGREPGGGEVPGPAGRVLELTRIIPDPDQPRKTFEEESLEHLARSLKTTGQLQPIRVRWSKPHGKWVIISGERRYRAALRAGFKSIACQFVDQELTETEVRQQSLIENLLREDFGPSRRPKGTGSSWT